MTNEVGSGQRAMGRRKLRVPPFCPPLTAHPSLLLLTAHCSLLCPLLLAGCGYMVGNAYQAEIRTVHVPVFESTDYRRGVEFQLTEAVQKQIQQRTPFRLAKGNEADTRLTGKIKFLNKNLMAESGFDDARQLQYSIYVEVTWEDLRTGRLLAEQQVPLDASAVQLITQSQFSPEIGQSLATAQQTAVDSLARRIVNMMEIPW